MMMYIAQAQSADHEVKSSSIGSSFAVASERFEDMIGRAKSSDPQVYSVGFFKVDQDEIRNTGLWQTLDAWVRP